MMNIGDYIRAKRREAGYTIKELSEKTGISQGGIQQIETNRRPNPRTDTLIKLEKVLDLSDINRKTGLILPGIWSGSYGIKEKEEDEDLFNPAGQDDSILSFMEGTPFEDFPEPIRDDHIYVPPMVMDAVMSRKLIPEELREILNKLSPELREEAKKYYLVDKFIYLPLINEKIISSLPERITENLAEEWLSLSKAEDIKANFAIRAGDNSMDEEGIKKGAICFIKRQNTGVTGDILLLSAVQRGETIIRKMTAVKDLKIFQNGKGQIESPDKEFKVIGKVVRVEFNLE